MRPNRLRSSSNRVLIIVQNLPVPLDRRVWLECQALVRAGFTVSVICPKGPGDPSTQFLDGVAIHKYRPAPATAGLVSYMWEFLYCWVCTALLSIRVWRRAGFDVIQACNPPDTFWLLARFWRTRGVRFVYDQHDLNPELFVSRFGQPRGLKSRLQHRFLLWLERSTYRTADEVVSTNESYRRTAVTRGGYRPDHVTVVRSGPDTRNMRPGVPQLQLRQGRRHLLVYLGIMGPQDGVDIALRAFALLVHEQQRDDVHLALLGFGDCFDELVALASELGVADRTTFTGRAGPETVAGYLSSAVVGLCPDPSNPLNDVSTMNKVMEYMAFATPVVSFDLPETRVSAGPTGTYADPVSGAAGLAAAIASLLDDPERRLALAIAARARAVADLDWRPQAAKYVDVFKRVCGVRSTPSNGAAVPVPRPAQDDGRPQHAADDPLALVTVVRARALDPDANITADDLDPWAASSRGTPESSPGSERPPTRVRT
jgi:glycosyltransferase involved in cell wall biosynthesis